MLRAILKKIYIFKKKIIIIIIIIIKTTERNQFRALLVTATITPLGLTGFYNLKFFFFFVSFIIFVFLLFFFVFTK
jgi:hypothetical protein